MEIGDPLSESQSTAPPDSVVLRKKLDNKYGGMPHAPLHGPSVFRVVRHPAEATDMVTFSMITIKQRKHIGPRVEP